MAEQERKEAAVDASFTVTSAQGGSPVPLISVVTVTWNDVWSLSKTARSVFEQDCNDFEYIVIDGASGDGTAALVAFWSSLGLIDRSVCEADHGVYDAMNKGIAMATGRYVCFLNAGDVFPHRGVLSAVAGLLSERSPDGILGWGELGENIWASWHQGAAYKMSSLGFCHQSLYVRRELLKRSPFDAPPGKTDSDTLQLGRLFEQGARIQVVPEILAIRGIEPGISANLERTRQSILQTLAQEYPELTPEDQDDILVFRRSGQPTPGVAKILGGPPSHAKEHLALMTLDTLYQRQTQGLPAATVQGLMTQAIDAIWQEDRLEAERHLGRLQYAQEERATRLEARQAHADSLRKAIQEFQVQEQGRRQKLDQSRGGAAKMPPRDFVVSLTSFPARIQTVGFVIESLLDQTCRPAEIHLWLGKDEVPGRNWLPKRLLDLESQGLFIHFVTKTAHQYDKFLHNSQLNAKRPFVIVDDDVIYPPDSMRHLLDNWIRYPDCIVANRCHELKLDDSGAPAPYADWRREVLFAQPSFSAFPTGAGGVLYPPGFLSDPATTDRAEILARAPYADDIWLKFCALSRGVKTAATELSHQNRWYLRYTPTMKMGALHAANVDLGLNDLQLQLCAQYADAKNPGWRDCL